MGTLYVVGTPIGNLEDMTLRAIRILREVRLIAAEDTRSARVLLAHFDIHTPVTSFFEHNQRARLASVLEALAIGDVALISEAGMPGLSDPGYLLVREAITAGYPVVPIPGPTAAIAALIVSGLPSDRFLFLGFPPRRAAERQRWLADVAREPGTLVLYEAPHRLCATLADVVAVLGDRQVAVAEELTKRFESVWRGEASAALAHFTAHPPRGEFTLVIAGASAPGAEEAWPRARLEEAVDLFAAEGIAPATAARLLGRLTGLSRRELYQLILTRQADAREEERQPFTD
jgi:16S rRNA (cytidine1402-2'-O)-methyltransferase